MSAERIDNVAVLKGLIILKTFTSMILPNISTLVSRSRQQQQLNLSKEGYKKEIILFNNIIYLYQVHKSIYDVVAHPCRRLNILQTCGN